MKWPGQEATVVRYTTTLMRYRYELRPPCLRVVCPLPPHTHPPPPPICTALCQGLPSSAGRSLLQTPSLAVHTTLMSCGPAHLPPAPPGHSTVKWLLQVVPRSNAKEAFDGLVFDVETGELLEGGVAGAGQTIYVIDMVRGYRKERRAFVPCESQPVGFLVRTQGMPLTRANMVSIILEVQVPFSFHFGALGAGRAVHWIVGGCRGS